MPDLDLLWEELNQAPLHKFSDWPNRSVPKGSPGVYLIYDQSELIYVGMASKTLFNRLNQHARGSRSGDQFCVYVCDRLVLPSLSPEEIKEVSTGALLLDQRVKAYVRGNLSYRSLTVSSEQVARELENHGLRSAQEQGQSLLNSPVKG